MALSLNDILIWCEEEGKEFWQYMLYDDMRERGITMEESFHKMEDTFDAMCHTINTYKIERMSASGLVGSDGGILEKYQNESEENLNKQGKKPALCGSFMADAMVIALKMAESNACMRRIVAAPTAGSCGVIPAVLIPYYEAKLASKEDIVKALFVSGAIGQVIADRASISGAQGGCQAEIGSASAMAAGALTFLQGGDAKQICNAAALALKGLLGLVCDPVAGLVEIPCVKRNVIGTVNAVSCTDMAIAGVESKIPPDEVIDAMGEVGDKMDASLKETALGGLAVTPTAIKIAKEAGLESE
ncbi:L-serine dehydratase,iron-sulfur-dependent,alpha subunit [Clostridium bornimense]|uniref:L-serine dehydratase n=1 Tax=Clostridium bornimense TaxID=1216932 RepID=W6S1U3_9CLOT|nr:L-serine ammonia-lyase, iron-sulfur-dependent, subunit alpha [Clostridium bornimense]CDM69859.1 L-serine dehydratase,iron-sulfur-dependent,alpha subunit [Clostridium bornimense]